MDDPIENLKVKKRHLRTGRILGSISIVMSTLLGVWQAWLLPIVETLSQQGRMHEGDSDGCFYGLLFVLTIFVSPLTILVAVILAALGFRLKARTLAIIAWIIALLTLVPMWPAWMSFFQ